MNMLSLIGLVTTVLFGGLSVVFYLKSTRYKELTLTFRITYLQVKTHPEVSIMFRGEQVTNLARMWALCWNSGSQPIRRSDLPRIPELKLPDGTRILSVGDSEASHEDVSFAVEKKDHKTIAFQFEYLNPGEGGLIEILLEENASAFTPAFRAPVIGGRPPLCAEFAPRMSVSGVAILVICFGIPALGAIVGAVAVLLNNYRSLLHILLAAVLFAWAAAMVSTPAVEVVKRKTWKFPKFAESKFTAA